MKLINNIFCVILLLLISCNSNELPGINYDQFKNTKAEKLAEAVKNGDINEIERCVKIDNIDVNFKEPLKGNTVLKLAILSKNKKVIKKLLELGASPNIRKDNTLQSPFLFACDIFTNGGSDIEIINLLLRYKADINTELISDPKTGNYFQTPLIVSIDIKNNPKNELFYYLINQGADISKEGQNPSYCAIVRALDYDRMDLLKYMVINKKATIPDYTYIWNEGTTKEKRETLLQALQKKDYVKYSKNDLLRDEILDYLIAN